MFHTLALNQAITLAGEGVLNSRRSREVIAIISMVIGIGVYAACQLGARQAFGVDWGALTHSRTWAVLAYTPPGIAAYGLEALHQGEVTRALVVLAGLVVLGAITLSLAGRLVNLAFAGEGAALRRRRRSRGGSGAKATGSNASGGPDPSSTSLLGRLLPPAAQAMASKDSKLLLREPSYRMLFLQSIYLLVIFVIMLRVHGRGDFGAFSSGMVWFMGAVCSFFQSSVLYNLFGIEGHAASTLLLFPAPRRHLVLGKNLAFFRAFALLNVLIAVVLGLVSGQPEICWRLATWMVLAVGLHVSVGNFVSIWFPFRVVMRGRRLRPASASQGMAYALVSFVSAGVALLLSVPVLAAIVVPTYFVSAYWMVLTLPAAVCYVAGLYVISLGQAEKMLLAREVQIVEHLGQVD